MKKLFIYSLLAFCTLGSCKKDPKLEEPVEEPNPIPNPNPGGGGGNENAETIPATADVYLMGSKYEASKEKYMLWGGDTGNELTTGYDLDRAAIEGLFIQEKDGAKTVNFFGSWVISQFKERIAYFGKKNYTFLSEKLAVPIAPDFSETLIAHVNHNKQTYLLARALSTDLTDKRYYYKINRAGEPSFHELIPNKEYKFIAVDGGNVFLSHHDVRLLWTDLSLYSEHSFLGNFRSEIKDFSFINPLDMTMLNDETAIFICSARNDLTNTSELFFVTVNVISKAVKSYKLQLPQGFSIGTMTVKGNSVLVPGNVYGEKTAYYHKFDFNNSVLVATNKITLESNGNNEYNTSLLHVNGDDIYVTGKENGKPCYWKNGTITRLKTGSDLILGINDIKN